MHVIIIDTVTHIHRWKRSISRRSYDEHSSFSWDEVTWRELVTWPWSTWGWVWKNSQQYTDNIWTGAPITAAVFDEKSAMVKFTPVRDLAPTEAVQRNFGAVYLSDYPRYDIHNH